MCGSLQTHNFTHNGARPAGCLVWADGIRQAGPMTSIDIRTRFQGDVESRGPEWLLTGLADQLRETGALAARGVAVLELGTLGFQVDDVVAHLAVAGDRLVAREGSAPDGPVVVLDPVACDELFQDVTSAFGLVLSGRAAMARGTTDEFVAWQPVVRTIIDAVPVYEPGSLTFRDRAGDDLDLMRSFRLDDPREEVAHFLAEAGFLHLEGVFTEDEMAAVSADLDRALAAATRDDGASWWARNDDGWMASRVIGFNRRSGVLQELLLSDRFRAVGRFTDDEMVDRPHVDGDSAEGLHKRVGIVEGISDVSWHTDCSLGGHSRSCRGLVVGISVTGADARSGELGVVAGSHRANVQSVGIRPGLDLPRRPLPTRTGDVTVHCGCTLHMSRPPVDKERSVVYTGFGLAPRAGDHRPELSAEEIRARRAALNDQSRRLQRMDDFGRDHELFVLEEST